MTARTERRTADRRELNRRTVNQVAASRNESSFSRTEWEALDRNERKRLAQDARNRLDDGAGRPGDRVLARVFDEHCQDQPAFCLVCGRQGQGRECDGCHTARDVEVERAGDL